ncbi:SGNH/GDSL hydrolase family protein [Arthrobacter sp. Alg241-R88]|uniref:SGNH/GDSL hydrolase family protein n=1 Tax=Arthrobacter sp. Alg241-R88 TaxID=2305984 RepID=UPI0013D09634|nr:SGNH/GDSL hydrolase family protein [Arthrobacter sp. Alg241-R88]
MSHHKSTGPVTSTTSHIAPVEADGIVLHWGNVAGDHTPPYAANSSPITVTASITTSSGSHNVTWAGQPNVTIAGGSLATSDPIGWVVAGGTVSVTATVTSSGNVPTMEGYSDGTGAYLVGPLAITGGTPTPDTTDRWLFLGNSVSEGVGDTLHGRSGQDGTGGYPERLATKADVAYLNAAASGERLGQLPAAWAARVGDTLAEHCSHALIAYIVNDIQVYTATELADTHAEYWGTLTATVPNVYAVTCLPRTGTDGTTIAAGATERQAWNAWLRDGAPAYYQAMFSRWQGRPTGDASADTLRIGETGDGRTHPLAGILDAAAVVAGTNPDHWKPGYTSDGVHPNTTGHAAIATALNLP